MMKQKIIMLESSTCIKMLTHWEREKNQLANEYEPEMIRHGENYQNSHPQHHYLYPTPTKMTLAAVQYIAMPTQWMEDHMAQY